MNNCGDIGGNIYINSYVILDLETTGLPQREFNRTKVTEITLVSVLRQHILGKFNDNQIISGKTENIDYIPRTINKLSECVFPCRRISDSASTITDETAVAKQQLLKDYYKRQFKVGSVLMLVESEKVRNQLCKQYHCFHCTAEINRAPTGLTNEILEPFHSFDETLFNILMGCLDRLKKPICIIAHNGFRFDFPILQAEIQKLNKMFPDDILCADSLQGFKNLLSPPLSNILKEIQPLSEQKEENRCEVSFEWDSDEYNELLLSATIMAENDDNKTIIDNTVSQVNKRQCEDGEWHKKINESTPSRRTTGMVLKQTLRKSKECSIVTPPNSPNYKTTVNPKKKLLFNQSKDKPNAPKSFKLIDVYEYLTNRPLSNAHKAETDAMALLECITTMGPTFLDWVDNNNKLFNSIKKLW